MARLQHWVTKHWTPQNAAVSEGAVDWTVSFTELPGAAVVRTGGVFNVADHRRMVADIVGRQEWRPGYPILFDHRQLDFGGAGLADMRRAREIHLAHEADIGTARSAILMKSAADYGLGRQFQLLTADSTSAELRIFDNEPAAREWLFAPKASQPK